MTDDQITFDFDEAAKVLTFHLSWAQYFAINADPLGAPEELALAKIIGPKIVAVCTEIQKLHGPMTVRAQVLTMGALAMDNARPMTAEESAKYYREVTP